MDHLRSLEIRSETKDEEARRREGRKERRISLTGCQWKHVSCFSAVTQLFRWKFVSFLVLSYFFFGVQFSKNE